MAIDQNAAKQSVMAVPGRSEMFDQSKRNPKDQ